MDVEESEKDPLGLPPAAREQLLESARKFLEMAELATEAADEDLTVAAVLERRARIGELWEESNALTADALSSVGLSSAQKRMIAYLTLHRLESVPAARLGGVSAIWEWARRSRELRVEKGWQVVCGPSSEPRVEKGHYLLAAEERDAPAARHWSMLSTISKRDDLSAAGRMLLLFQEAFPEAVHIDDLDYVAKIRSRDRRKRDLEEAGWRIGGREVGLPAGFYRLESLEQGPPRARDSLKLRQKILAAADYTCELCGAKPSASKSVELQVHHRQFVRDGGNDDPDNLQVLCSACHAGVHATTKTSVADELLEPDRDPLIS